MSKIICRICLRTDLKTQDIDEVLVNFHDELTEFAIYENNELKYCLVCEHLLRKFYNFSQKCLKANYILKALKRGKNGGFPSNLHKLLPPSPLVCTIPSTFQFNINNDEFEPLTEEFVTKPVKVKYEFGKKATFQYNVNNDTFEPMTEELVIEPEQVKYELGNKVEKNSDSEDTDVSQTDYDLLESHVHVDGSGNCYFARSVHASKMLNEDQQEDMKRKTLLELADIDLRDGNVPGRSQVMSTLKEPQKYEEQNTNIEEDQEDYYTDIEMIQDDFDEDSSDTVIINVPKKEIQAKSKPKNKPKKKKGSSIPKPRIKPPLKNMKELEKVFDIQVFATDEEAKDELQQRQTSERYLSAVHKCKICYTICKFSKQLDYHMKCHDPSAGDVECPICSMRFQSKDAFWKHKDGAHYGKFKCKKCPMVTYQKKSMGRHYLRHVEVTLTCEICNQTFKDNSTYKAHQRLKHTTDHVCVTCAQTFVSEKGLIKHRVQKHRTRSLVDEEATAHCAPCALTFADEQVYTVHVMNAERHKDIAKAIIACKICGERFEEKLHLRNHNRTKHPKLPKAETGKIRIKTNNEDNFTCSICGVEGMSKTWVLKHTASSHPDSPYMADVMKNRQHMCDTCGKCYTTVYALRDHINTHTGVRPYACKKCPLRFFTRTRLYLHEELHAPPRRVCPLCGQKFVSASNLSNHMRVHIQDRRYKCSLCPKGFLHSFSLREHVRGVHDNVRRVRKQVKREDVKEEP